MSRSLNRFGLAGLVIVAAAACNSSRRSVVDSGTVVMPTEDAGPNKVGDGGFELLELESTTLPTAPTLVQAADFDQDGKLDALVLYGQKGGHQAQVFLGVGDGTFNPGVTLETVQLPMSIALADFNGDGTIDAAIGTCAQSGSDAGLLMFAGDGKGNFAAAATTALAFCPFGLSVADINGDGVPDLVTAGPGPAATTPTTGEVRSISVDQPASRCSRRSLSSRRRWE